MRGHKVDNEFISEFIANCIQSGKFSEELMLEEAKNQLKNIDDKILEVEKLKIKRSKILDVVSAFTKEKQSKTNKIISLYNVHNVNIAKSILFKLKEKPVILDELLTISAQKEEIIFTIKNLLDNKVIQKTNGFFLKSDMYASYIKYILMDK